MAIRLLSLFRSFADSCQFVWKYRRRLGSDSDFVLRVAPLRDKKHSSYRNYFPPPLYGIPPGRSSGIKGDHSEHYGRYGLFLWPDALYREISAYMILLMFTSVPFITLFLCSSCGNEVFPLNNLLMSLIVIVFIVLWTRLAFIFLFRSSRPVLSNIWQLWPESQYPRFLTVPHYSDLDRKDKYKKGDKYYHKYWQPDESNPLEYQPAYYAKGKHTIQEVMLHLSVFDYLFHKKKKGDVHTYKSLRMRGWLFLFSPVWISYGLLFFSLFFTALIYPASSTENIPVLFRIPFWYVVLILIWSVMTSFFIMRQMKFLEDLHNDIEEGYYDACLDLIPQQILKAVEDLPDNDQIYKGIEQVQYLLKLVQAGALVTYLMVLEIFASGF